MVNELVKSEKSRDSLALFVSDNVSAMLAYWDKDLICRFANMAYTEWFGKTKEEMIDKMSIKELLGPLYEKNLPYILGALQGKRQTFEREIPIPTGGTRYSIANYFPDIVNGEVRGFCVHVADITSVKLLEKELIRLKAIEAKNKELEQFTYIASHDLQEPLRTISNYISIISKDNKQEMDEQVKKYLSIISQKTDRMSMLIKGLLDYSRIGRKSKLISVDTKKVIDNVISDLGNLIKTTRSIIHIGELPSLYVYETELRQVFQNLINNAIKFKKKNITPEIWIQCIKKDSEWEFSVKDNGIGIDPKHFDRIFNIFQRLNSELDYPGYGIGLAASKKIIEMHGGRIWIESNPGAGSTFHFTISNLKP